MAKGKTKKTTDKQNTVQHAIEQVFWNPQSKGLFFDPKKILPGQPVECAEEDWYKQNYKEIIKYLQTIQDVGKEFTKGEINKVFTEAELVMEQNQFKHISLGGMQMADYMQSIRKARDVLGDFEDEFVRSQEGYGHPFLHSDPSRMESY